MYLPIITGCPLLSGPTSSDNFVTALSGDICLLLKYQLYLPGETVMHGEGVITSGTGGEEGEIAPYRALRIVAKGSVSLRRWRAVRVLERCE
jgi:hypothetical protein